MKYDAIKRAIALICLGCMLLGLVACRPGDAENGTSAGGTESDVPPSDEVVLFENGSTAFSVIYPEDPSDALFVAARNLQSAFATYADVSIPIYEEGTDVKADADSTGFEILLGDTVRRACATVKEQMPDAGGYAVAKVGNQLVLYGKDGQAVANAVDWFIKTQLRTPASHEPDKKLSRRTFSEINEYYYTRVGIMTSVKIAGTELQDYRIVVPAEGYAEQYVAEMFCDYLFSYYGGKTPVIVTDKTAPAEHEIIIGNTTRTTLRAGEGEYRIAVTDAGLQAVSGHVTGYLEVYDALRKAIPSSKSTVELTAGEEWTGTLGSTAIKKDSDISVMYHNVLGYVDKYPAANRPNLALQIYLAYLPDVIGMQECGQSYYRSYAQILMEGLSKAGYREIVFRTEGGTGNPIFYNSDKLTLLKSGYDRARSGDKGTTWAVFAEKTNPEKIFAVTNSHFAANSNAGGNANRGNTYRVADAQVLLKVVNQIQTDYPEIPIIVGGDFNSSASSDPGRTLREGGLTHATGFAKVSADYSAWIGYPVYDAEKGYYLPRSFVWANIGGALDHVMFGGNLSAITAPEYAILKDRLCCVVSDHLPQLIYVDWNH